MSPRRYRLGRRAAAVEATRRRILEAAVDLYRSRGIRATSMQEVARRAEVAPATVLNHFRTPDDLATAVVAHLLASLAMPTAAIFRGISTPTARVRALARELALFYERSEPFLAMHERERGAVPALAAVEARFYVQLGALFQEALGPLAHDRDAHAAVAAVLAPAALGQLRAGGRTATEAANLAADVLAPWLATRSRKATRSRSKRKGRHLT